MELLSEDIEKHCELNSAIEELISSLSIDQVTKYFPNRLKESTSIPVVEQLNIKEEYNLLQDDPSIEEYEIMGDETIL